jgi:rhodanese-related sulfurtransferase
MTVPPQHAFDGPAPQLRTTLGYHCAVCRMTMPDPLPMETTCQDVAKMLRQGEDFLLLDCREPDEHRTAHIAQATLLPMSQLAERVGELEPHRQRRIVVHCHHGGRSLRVAAWLREQGFAGAQSMDGGIDRWSLEVDPQVPRY